MPKKVVDLHPLDRRLNLPVISTLNPKWVSKQNNYIQLHPPKTNNKKSRLLMDGQLKLLTAAADAQAN
jgi:hypothetical protein